MISTGKPNELVAQIHTRMPVILPEEDHAKCLRETEDGEPEGTVEAISGRPNADWPVNSPNNDDPETVI
jgi:putative SOS response-associated peptidase YedK